MVLCRLLWKKLLLHPPKKANLPLDFLKNYRPVSGLPFISKIVEKVVASRLRDHMTYNNLNEPFQSAYRKFHSVESALLHVQNDVLLSLDKGQSVFLVLLDLSTAFDTIDHGKLLFTLHDRIGVADNALRWFASHLRDQSQDSYKWFQIGSVWFDMWCTSGFCAGATSVYGVHLGTGRYHYGSRPGIPYVCRWHPTVSFLWWALGCFRNQEHGSPALLTFNVGWQGTFWNSTMIRLDKSLWCSPPVLENQVLQTVPYMLVIFVFLRFIV